MLKPRAVFQQSESIDGQGKKEAAPANVPRLPISSTYGYGQEYDRQQNQVPRRLKHIEGHIMMEVLPQELASLLGYRCLCGKHVADESFEESLPNQAYFMRCQGRYHPFANAGNLDLGSNNASRMSSSDP